MKAIELDPSLAEALTRHWAWRSRTMSLIFRERKKNF